MKHAIYEKRFNYEMECRRFDAPEEDVGKWLEDQAVEVANRKTRGDWVVFRTKLEKQDDGLHTYTVLMKPFIA
jgi:hypothetical protein